LVQVFAGHKCPNSTEKYRQTGIEELKAGIEKYHPLKLNKNMENNVKLSNIVPIMVHKLKKVTMRIVTIREFRDNQKKYFDMVDNKEQVIVKRKNCAYKLVPVSDDDMLVDIPKEYRCDPYEISPSGDVFWADKRNVEIVKKAIENKDQIADKLNSADDVKNFLNSL
jgi:hypothetical protein